MPRLPFAATALLAAFACGTATPAPPSAVQGDAGSPSGGGDGGAPPPGGSPDSGTSPDGGGGSTGGTADAGTGNGSGGNDGGSAGGSAGGSSSGGNDAGSAGGSGDAGTPADAGSASGDAHEPDVLTKDEDAVALAIDADRVYWLNIRRVPTSEITYRFVDVRSMAKSGGAASTLAETSSTFGTNIVAPEGVVVWSAADCAPPCDYPGASSEQAIFTLDSAAPHGYRRITGAFGGSQVAATSTIAFSRHLNGVTGQWDLTGCAIDGSACSTVVSDRSIAPALYVDSGRIYWIHLESTPLSSGGKLFWNDAAAPYAARGQLAFPGFDTGLRVNGDQVATRAGAEIWTGTLGGPMTRVWVATTGSEIDIAHGRMYWNQSPFVQFEGCLGSANLDGTDGKCLDHGQHQYGTVRVDEQHVWYIRDGQIVRLPR